MLACIWLVAGTSCLAQGSYGVNKNYQIDFSNEGGDPSLIYRTVYHEGPPPLYVLVNYPGGKRKHFEYFRIDTSRYIAQEFFYRTETDIFNGLKSTGMMRVTDRITGESTKRLYYIDGREGEDITYYRALAREGLWTEYEDSVFYHLYWTGQYADNKRVGVWKHIAYGMANRFVMEEIDYSLDSTHKLYSANITHTVSLDSLTLLLTGQWNPLTCDEGPNGRMFYKQCQPCDHATDAKVGYYRFAAGGRLQRLSARPCDQFRKGYTNGQWRVVEKDGERFINLQFTNGQSWRLKILYLDRKRNLVTDK